MGLIGTLRAVSNRHAVAGILFVAVFAAVATLIAGLGPIRALGISPLIIGIIAGMLYGNLLRRTIPVLWMPGIVFTSKTILRLAVILYGFRLTFQDLWQVGLEGISLSVIMVATTFLGGSWLGIKMFKLSRPLAMMTASGSAVCGAAAVLATEPVVNGKSHESSIAVGTVVVFGTLAMFVYPLVYSSGLLDIPEEVYGLYTGGTVHEVAHVVAAGGAVSFEAANTAVIVKMLRVMLIAPLLIALGIWLSHHPDPAEQDASGVARKGGVMASFPWFAVVFILCTGFNSLHLLPASAVQSINVFDTFLLTMAMTALGMDTSFEKVRSVGPKPFVLAAILAIWLAVGGYAMTHLVVALFG